jgi:hypothetical protein
MAAGGSTSPTSRIDAKICRYLWLDFTVFPIAFTGRIDEMGMVTKSESKA